MSLSEDFLKAKAAIMAMPDLILRLHREGHSPDEIAAELMALDRASEADAAGISIAAVIEEAASGVEGKAK
jgi:uncharacterized protein (DUF433 family)